MDSDITSEKLSALDDLLDAERTALLKGDLEALSGMLESKEALIDAVNAGVHTDIDTLQQLNRKVQRNQLLLDGALEGIRNVARRMAALRRIRSNMETYDSSGKKRNIDIDNDHSVEKRA
jgi:hypothetical protein